MRYKRFEDLPVWNTAIELAVKIFALTAQAQFKPQPSLRDQLERAGVSVSNNIAEGFERGTNKELLMFLYIARGSAGEVRSMCSLLDRLPDFIELKTAIRDVKMKAESCSKQLKAWAESIQNSDYQGERHVTEKVKRSENFQRQREEFLQELLEIRKKNAASHN
jgi:four helix bundle protein